VAPAQGGELFHHSQIRVIGAVEVFRSVYPYPFHSCTPPQPTQIIHIHPCPLIRRQGVSIVSFTLPRDLLAHPTSATTFFQTLSTFSIGTRDHSILSFGR
jgi:hypothetical protein